VSDDNVTMMMIVIKIVKTLMMIDINV